MERYVIAQEKKENRDNNSKKKEKKSTKTTIKLKLKVPPRTKKKKAPSPVDPWMVVSDDEGIETKSDPYAAESSEILLEEKEEEEEEGEIEPRRVLRTRQNKITTVVPYTRRVACVPCSRFDAGRLLADCADVWTFVNNFSSLLQLETLNLSFENFTKLLSSPNPKAEITSLYIRLLDILLRDRDSMFQDSEPLWTIGPEQSIVVSLTSEPDRCVKIDTTALIRENNRWTKPISKMIVQTEDGYVYPIMSHEIQSHYFCPSRLLPAGASGIGNLGTVKKKRRKLVIKKTPSSGNERELPKRFKCLHCSRMFSTMMGRSHHIRQVHNKEIEQTDEITTRDLEQKRRARIIKAYMTRMKFGQGCMAHMVADLRDDAQFRKEIAYWLDWHPRREWTWSCGEKIWKWFLDTENRRNLGMAIMPNRCAKMVRVRVNGVVSKRIKFTPLCKKCAKHLTRPMGHGTHRYKTKEINGWGAFYKKGETREITKKKKKKKEAEERKQKENRKDQSQEKRKKNKKRNRIALSSTGATRCQICFLEPEENEEIISCSTCT